MRRRIRRRTSPANPQNLARGMRVLGVLPAQAAPASQGASAVATARFRSLTMATPSSATFQQDRGWMFPFQQNLPARRSVHIFCRHVR